MYRLVLLGYSLSLYAYFLIRSSIRNGLSQRWASFLLGCVVLMFFANSYTISPMLYCFSRCLQLQYFVQEVLVCRQFSSSSFLSCMICLARSFTASISPLLGSSSTPQQVSRFIPQRAQLGDILMDSWKELLYANLAKCRSSAQSSQCQLQQILKNPLIPQFQCLVYPLVYRWNAVNSFRQTFRQKQKADQNLLVNTLPQSNTILAGIPWSLT